MQRINEKTWAESVVECGIQMTLGGVIAAISLIALHAIVLAFKTIGYVYRSKKMQIGIVVSGAICAPIVFCVLNWIIAEIKDNSLLEETEDNGEPPQKTETQSVFFSGEHEDDWLEEIRDNKTEEDVVSYPDDPPSFDDSLGMFEYRICDQEKQ